MNLQLATTINGSIRGRITRDQRKRGKEEGMRKKTSGMEQWAGAVI
jgi:hypothetical protein